MLVCGHGRVESGDVAAVGQKHQWGASGNTLAGSYQGVVQSVCTLCLQLLAKTCLR